MRLPLIFFSIACFAVPSLLTIPGRAQSAEGFALDRFQPSERGSRWFVLDSLDLRGKARPAFGIVGAWSRNPLVLRDGNGDVTTSIVEQQLVMHAGASVVLANRVRLAGNLPVGAYQTGQQGAVGGTTLPAPSTTAVGDARMSGDVRLVGEYRSLFTSTVGLEVRAPTGDRDAYMSDHVFSATPRALAAGRVGPFVYGGRLGVHLRPGWTRYGGSDLTSSVVFGAAAGAEVADERVHLGAELFGSTAIEGNEGPFRAKNTPIEILFGGHARLFDELVIGLGVGPGLTRGYGSPDIRGLASLEWAPRYREESRPAPQPVEPASRPTPEATPQPVAFLDRDGDGVSDAEDACPAVAGVRTDDARRNGCPSDRDGDNIADAEDACPHQRGPADPDPTRNGCPIAELVGSQIQIRDQIKFRFGSAELDPAGDAVLTAVLGVLDEHREIKRVRVEGHTDSVGAHEQNAALSAARAKAVIGWLSTHGIASSRLLPKGYGPDRPLTTNDTEEGRRQNRRVEFHVTPTEEIQ